MKGFTAIGFVVAGIGILGGATMEGSSPGALMNIPAIMIVFGGTLGATMAGTAFETIKNIPNLYKLAITHEPPDLNGKVAELVSYAEKARRDGLLALDEQLSDIEDPYLRKGLQLVVDGTDADLVAEVLETENAAMRKRHKHGVQPFEKAGGYGPTMGIIGTVFGLVHVLGNLSSPETLGPSISAAFIATLLGVASANVIYFPTAARLKSISDEELHLRELVLEGILAIQAGDNPRMVEEKLQAFVSPDQRVAGDDAGADGAGEGAAAKRAA